MRRLPHSWKSTFSKLGFSYKAFDKRAAQRQHRRLGVESLEDRRMLATLTVNTTLDIIDNSDSLLSLREAVQAINTYDASNVPAGLYDNQAFGVSDKILFDSSLGGGEIQLGSLGQLSLGGSESIAVDASSLANGLTIKAYDPNLSQDGDGNRVFSLFTYSGFQNPMSFELSGLTLTGGDTSSSGGALHVDLAGSDLGGTLTLRDVNISGNRAGTSGGGVHVITQSYGSLGTYDTQIEIHDSSISNNHAEDSGGGINFSGSNSFYAAIYRTAIDDNYSGEHGGGINYADSVGELYMYDTSVSGNTAMLDGGGFSGGGSTTFNDVHATIEFSTFNGNTSQIRSGGGLHIGTFQDGTPELVIRNSTFSDNSADRSGGGVYFCAKDQPGTVNIANSTIWSNQVTSANGEGGGLFLAQVDDGPTKGTFNIVNTTVAENIAAEGGGVKFSYVGFGGGLPVNIEATSHNSIFANNYQDVAKQQPNNIDTGFLSSSDNGTVMAFVDAQNNLVGLGPAGGLVDGVDNNQVGKTAAQVRLDTQLRNNGGLTKTAALLPGSLAIDRGANSLAQDPEWSIPLDEDQRGAGFLRQLYGEISNTVDIGAFEYNSPLIVTTSQLGELDNNLTQVTHPNDLSLREALKIAALRPGHDTITFDAGLTGWLDFYNGEMVINSDVTIQGLGADQQTISTAWSSRLFSVLPGVTAEIRDVTLTEGYNIEGGVIFNQGNLTITNSELSQGSADAGGAIWNGGNLTVSGSLFVDNFVYSDGSISSSDPGGGAIYSHWSAGQFTAVNSTFSNNGVGGNAWGGSAIFVNGGTTNLVNLTITNNYAFDNDYATAILALGSTTIHNSIVAGNSNSGSISSADVAGYFNSGSSNNLIGVVNPGSAFSGNGNQKGSLSTPLNPMLGTLANNGGPTRTHALLTGSSAIDAGNDALAIAFGLLGDQRDEDRFQDGDGVGGDQVDIGAFELAFS